MLLRDLENGEEHLIEIATNPLPAKGFKELRGGSVAGFVLRVYGTNPPDGLQLTDAVRNGRCHGADT